MALILKNQTFKKNTGGFSKIVDIVIFETPDFLAGQSIFHLINCINKVVVFNLIFSEHLLRVSLSEFDL
jgi:hypothetical protein